jgi:hypothetical protein
VVDVPPILALVHVEDVALTRGTVGSLPIAVPVPEGATAHPEFYSIGGAHVAFEYTHPTNAEIGARFELDQPVTAPDTTFFEFGLRFPPGYPPKYAVGHGVMRKAREMNVWVHFTPDATPDWVEEFEDRDGGEEVFPRTLNGGTASHAVRHGFGPGFFVIRWGYHKPQER